MPNRQQEAVPDVWELRLYVAGKTPRSVAAFANLKQICQEHLEGPVSHRGVDLLLEPQLGRGGSDLRHPDARAEAPRARAQDHRRSVEHRTCAGGPEHPAGAQGVVSHGRTRRRDRKTGCPGGVRGRRERKRPGALRPPAVSGRDERAVARRDRQPADDLRATPGGALPLEVVDVYQQPDQARAAQLVAAPTLIKELPLPVRRLLGDLSNTDKVLVGLDLIKR